MKLGDIVSFRKDLLFNGAVQIGWLESNQELADKAASHFAFHGPSYHGIVRESQQDPSLRRVDTATFAIDIIERLTGAKTDEPFALAIAGYGTGKSHLAVTLASLLGTPGSPIADRILKNLSSADADIGKKARALLGEREQPFLVVAINGMKDFDLTGEIVRQVVLALNNRGLDTTPLEDLRPRFMYATNFAESFFDPLQQEFGEAFGALSLDEIIECLRRQDEETFQKVSAIYERRMGFPIRVLGQESLHDFVRVAREVYCGEGKPYAGMLILFDEFGRYLEFSVQRPQVAGPGALQQLFEAVQANADDVFLLSFIQYELKAYISRIAPELRDDLQRYVTRYDVVQKVRLSTNLETLIANLFQKRNLIALDAQVAAQPDPPDGLQADMMRWFPDLGNHAIWSDTRTFARVIFEGCWPLHPLSTWLLYRLASVGHSLQQRSALSLVADAYSAMEHINVPVGFSISPVDLCSDALVDEFVASERFGQQGTSAQAYKSVLSKYEHQMDNEEVRTLRAVLLMAKINPKIASKEGCIELLALFAGRSTKAVSAAIHSLESEIGALTWSEALHQYEIASDAVPRAQFVAYLERKLADISAATRATIFSENYARWFPDLIQFRTDFGLQCHIPTKEWSYQVSFANVHLLRERIEAAFRSWLEARAVDAPKGQLIYCYVGGESNLSAIRELARARLRRCLEEAGLSRQTGAPIAVSFLYDQTGAFGVKIAEYWVLQQGMEAKEAQRYANYVLEGKSSAERDLRNLFETLRNQREMVFATEQQIPISMLGATLTRLFATVYPEHIPFPFDGFAVATGNAASDCSLFIRELFLGHLDRDWVTARSRRQRNRAVRVLNDCWGAFDNAGALRLLPANESVRRAIDSFDSQITGPGEPNPLNLGRALRALCGPPCGCSTASAGLLLALFVGARKGTLDLYEGGRLIGVEPWLQEALPRNYLELSVLDNTTVVRVSKEAVNEWNRMLNAWEIETTYSGQIDYRRQACELAERMPVPQALFYQHENLCLKASEAQRELDGYNSTLAKALEGIQARKEMDDIEMLASGAADLSGLRTRLKSQDGLWTEDQIRVVEDHEAQARLETQRRFWRWLDRQSVDGIAQLAQFQLRMTLVMFNLDTLHLTEEKAALEQRVKSIVENLHFLDGVDHLCSDIEYFDRVNKPHATMPLRTIATLLERVAEFEQRLAEAEERRIKVLHSKLEAAAAQLGSLRQAYDRQAKVHRERASRVSKAEIKTLADIHALQTEMITLRQLFEGHEDDLRDFGMIQRQLDAFQASYRRLDSNDLSESELQALLGECAKETARIFGDDAPPLDNDGAYEGMARTIRARRQRDAEAWIRAHVPREDAVYRADAQQALEIRTRLRAAPRYLAPKQMDIVKRALEACEERLDELEVDGLVFKYEALSEPGKQTFLWRIGVAKPS